jgi:DNA-binding winged helix-turn-helix (wHTH) protein/Tol biopolymer transport system component
MSSGSHNGAQIIQFGTYEVDLRTGELRRNGSKVKLQEQPFQILTMLLERPGQVLTRKELRERLWPADTFVDFDHSLNAAIRRLRDALGDSAENPRFVGTVARRGYQFLAPVNGESSGRAIEAPPQPAVALKRGSILALGMLLLACTAAGWTLLYRLRQTRPIQPQVSQRRLTANPEEAPVLGAAISPDGKYLAFSDRTGFYLRQIDSGETHSVSLPADFAAVPAAWYPDGAHLVAAGIGDPTIGSSLWRVSIMGGEPRKLIEDGRLPAISPDGSRVAFVRGPKLAEEIWIAESNGENPRQLVAGRMYSFGGPAWSPDGRSIAFVMTSYAPEQWQVKTNIVRLDLETGRKETVLIPPNSSVAMNSDPELGPGLVWTRDNYLLYSVSEPPPEEDDSNVWSLPLDPNGRAAGPAVRLTAAPDEVSAINASADDTRIAYTKNSLSPSVYVAELTPGEKHLGPFRRLTLDNWRDFPFSWTPDGKTVLFTSDRDGTYHLFKQRIDQTMPELLVGGNEEVMLPRLAPDNSTVLYETWPKIGESAKPHRLMRIPFSGGPSQFVLQHDGMGNMQCARSPSQLCLYDVRTASEILFFSFDPATGKRAELSQLKIQDESPYVYNWSLSPDGRILATAKGKLVQSDPSIAFYSVEDGSKRSVRIKGWTGISSIDFAADGRSLWAPAFTNSGKWALLNIGLNGQTKIVLEETSMTIGWAIPSPDGRHLALWEARGNSNVWLLQRNVR